MWRTVWQWIDDDFNDARPWSILIFGLVISAVAGIPHALFGDNDFSGWVTVVGCGVLLSVVLPYYLYRQLKNLWRITKKSGADIPRSRGSD